MELPAISHSGLNGVVDILDFEMHFLVENMHTLIQILLKFIPECLIDKLVLVQVVARWQTDNKLSVLVHVVARWQTDNKLSVLVQVVARW